MTAPTVEQYHVGIICALNHEMTAAIAMLDEQHQPVADQDELDSNNYILGKIDKHNVVVACLPSGVYGTNAAARVANDMLRTFTGLRFGLMVGIGGGIPNLAKGLDVRLGDVVISQPDQTFGGVVQYDLRKNLGDEKFERKGFLKSPPTVLLAALSTLRARHELEDSKVPAILVDIFERYPRLIKNGYGHPGCQHDILSCHCNDASAVRSCDFCTNGRMRRDARDDQNPAFWYGTIASGNELMKNSVERDRLGWDFGALCVEMEAAGLMNDFPCIVIRGICDYADNQKNDRWQKYAALVAAAYAKEFLAYVSPQQTNRERRVQDVVASIERQSSLIAEHVREVKQEYQKQDRQYRENQYSQCHQTLKTSTYKEFKDVNPARVKGTCQWVLSHSHYQRWLANSQDDLLWISADPGCGKSVLAKSLIDNELRSSQEHSVCYFFFKDNDAQNDLATALCALLHQLFAQKPHLTRYAISAWEKSGNKLTNEKGELWQILLAAVKDDDAQNVTCVLDALDECRFTDRQQLVATLAEFYTKTSSPAARASKGSFKFLVTSRAYADIHSGFASVPENLSQIRLSGELKNDQIHREIDQVIQIRVMQLAKELRLTEDLTDRLREKLLSMEHRTYLWLHLAIDAIYDTYRNSLRPDEAVIESLPSSVEDAYEKLLNRINEAQNPNAKRILQIVVGARRPFDCPRDGHSSGNRDIM